MQSRRATHQRGYVLLEITIALLIATLVAVLGVQTVVHRINDAEARAAAVWMQAVHRALIAYVRAYGSEIRQAASPEALELAGFTDWRAPTLAELASAGFLSGATPESVVLTGQARLAVWRTGSCPGEACRVEGLVYGARPLLGEKSGVADEAMIAQWLLSAEGAGVAVHANEPERIRGAGMAFSSMLPAGVILPVGTVGMGVTADHAASFDFLRVGDHRNPDFQNDLSVVGEISAGRDIATAGQLVIGARSTEGGSCAPDDAVAHEHAGGLLVCRNSRWRSVSRTGGGGYGLNQIYGCKTSDGVSTANPITGNCSCPTYSTAVQIFDSGPKVFPEGRQYAYLCVG